MNYLERTVLFLSVSTVVFFVTSICKFVFWKKNKNTTKKHKPVKMKAIKDARVTAILALVIGFLSLFITVNVGLDLVKKDYIVTEGVMVDSRRTGGRRLGGWRVKFVVDGETESLSVSMGLKREFEEGKEYKITYGRRSEILIDVE